MAKSEKNSTETFEVLEGRPIEDKDLEKVWLEMPIAQRILRIRGQYVMLDRDLADIYGVETKALKRAVKRNLERFPEDFCFELSKEESLRYQFGTLKNGRGQHSKYLPYAFTEQGVAMLSGVLHSEIAVNTSIEIMRAFVYMRRYMLENSGVVERLTNVESKVLDHEHKINEIFAEMDKTAVKTKGLFFENQEFDAYVFVCGLIKMATKRIVLVDNYVDEKVLAMLLKRAPNVSATIYTYSRSKIFQVDLSTYNEQYKDYPLAILPSYGIHDRFLFIDDCAYHFGASLKDLGKNTFFFSRETFTLEEILDHCAT